jgi:hypothetical protein
MFFHQNNHMAHDRSRTLWRSLALAGAAVLSAASLSGAAAANAAPATSTSFAFLSGGATFRVGGHAWRVSVSNFSDIGTTGIEIDTGHENDQWSFNSSPSLLTVNQRTGNATFNAHNSFAPVAFVTLKFTATKRHKATCTSGSETDFSGNVSGSLTLIANRALTFKSAHAQFTGGSLSIDHGCVPPTAPLPCGPGIWIIGSPTVNANGTASGVPGQRNFVASVFENVKLKTPKGARIDIGVAASANKPVFNSTKKTLQESAQGVISGSVLFKASGPPSVTTSNCVLGSNHFKARDAVYPATFASPRGGEFQTRTIVAGLLKAPRSGVSFFDIMTFKRA